MHFIVLLIGCGNNLIEIDNNEFVKDEIEGLRSIGRI